MKRLAERLDDLLNPVLLKELRQAVRGRFVVTALVLSLIAEVVTIATMYVAGEMAKFRLDSNPVGAETFAALFSVILFVSMLFVPFYCGIRMASERSDSNTDLMYITTISPRTVILGKMMAVMAFVALLFGAALPFLAFAYVLRGLDLWIAVTAIVIALLVIMSEAAVALFVGALPLSRPFKLLLALALVPAAITLVSVSNLIFPRAMMATLLAAGSSSSAYFSSARVAIITLCVAVIMVDAIFVTLTISMLTPAPANRALPIRIMLTVLWTVSLGVAFRGAVATKLAAPLEVWAWAQIAVIGMVLLSAVGEREMWGKRVARTIPRRSLTRAAAFLFYSGSGGGIAWCGLMLVLTFSAFLTGGNLAPMNTFASDGRSESADLVSGSLQIASAGVAILAYGLTAVRIHRRFFARKVMQKNTWTIVAIMLIFFGVIVPLIATLRFVETNQFQRVFEWSIAANPFASIDDMGVALARLGALLLWLTIMLAASRSWFKAQWSAFRRAEAAAS